MRRLVPAIVALLLVPATIQAGAAASGQSVASPAHSTADLPTVADGSTVQSNGSNQSDRPAITGLAFFTTYDRGGAPPVRIGFGTTEKADGFFVLQNESGAVVGKTEYRTFAKNLAVDGLGVPFTEPVHGIVTLTVTAYDDTNGNQVFDPGIDEPYRKSDGSPVAASLTFVIPNESGAIVGEKTELKPPTPGDTGLHHFRLSARQDLTVRAVALDYGYTGIDISETTNESAGVGLVDPEHSPYRTGAKRVEEPPSNVLVIYPDHHIVVNEGDEFVVNVDGLEIPDEPTNVTVLVNPENESHATTMTLVPEQPSPSIQVVHVLPEDPKTIETNLYFPTETTGVVVVERNGREIGRSDPVGGQPDMHVDFLEVRLDEELQQGDEITVSFYRDADGDGEYEQPFSADGEPVATTLTVAESTGASESSTTAPGSNETSTRSTTGTTTPGFGVGLAALAVLAAGLLLARF